MSSLFDNLVVDLNHPPDQVDNIPFGDRAVGNRDALGQIQFLVEFVAADPFQVVMALVEQLLHQESPGVVQRGRVARAHALEEFQQSRLGDGDSAGQIPDRFLAHGGGQ